MEENDKRHLKLFRNKDDVSTMQQLIGYDMIFRSFIVKDWFGKDKEESTHSKYNKVITKLCFKNYWMFWKERNDIMNKK